MKKIFSLMVAICLLLGVCACGNAEQNDDAAEAAALLEAVRGTYEPLFPVITNPEYDSLWLDPCVAALGEEMGAMAAEMLKSVCNGTIYGPEAVAAYTAAPDSTQFDCLFIGGVDQITFDGVRISGTLEGSEVFSHEYVYVSPLSLGGMMDGFLYETTDEDAGEFRYFFMMPDTPQSTYHLEFRYGSDIDALTQYAEGPYAYWLAAGFAVDADEEMIKNVIALFCEENLVELQEESEASAVVANTLEGDANVDQRNYPSTAPFIHPPFYNVRVLVIVDENGVITSVTDNGTGATGSVQAGNEEFWATKNKPYFDVAVSGGILDAFVGKTLDEVKAMEIPGVDTVSGATMTCAAAQEAVINALEGRTGKTFLDNESTVLPVESIADGQIVMSNALPADFDLQLLDIRYGVYNAEEEIIPADSYNVSMADGKVILTFQDPSVLKPGYYYVNVVDASGIYRSPAFEGGPAAAQAPYFVIDSGLTAEDISFDGQTVVLSEGAIADYLMNIEHVLIQAEGTEKATEQEPVGHHGTISTSFVVLGENGKLMADSVVKARDGSESPIFEAGKQYTVTIEAFGYPTLTFSIAK